MTPKQITIFAIVAVLALLALTVGGCYAEGQYKVYRSRMEGEAKLAEAESERQIQIADAKGKLEASKMLSDAEVQRAKGVAESMKIVSEELEKNPSYLHYLWVNRLSENGQDIIYVATEAGMPIFKPQKP